METNGICEMCNKKGVVNILSEMLKDFYYKKITRQFQTKKKITLCNTCFIILMKKRTAYEKRIMREHNGSATISSTSLQTASTSSVQSGTSSSLQISSSSPEIVSSASFPPISSQTSNNTDSNMKHTMAISSQSTVSTENPDSSKISDTTTNSYHNEKPAPLCKKRKRREKEQELTAVNNISSDDDDIIDPGVRCPTIQPLIKKRKKPIHRVRTPTVVPVFRDGDAPIFDTSHITGG